MSMADGGGSSASVESVEAAFFPGQFDTHVPSAKHEQAPVAQQSFPLAVGSTTIFCGLGAVVAPPVLAPPVVAPEANGVVNGVVALPGSVAPEPYRVVALDDDDDRVAVPFMQSFKCATAIVPVGHS